MNYIAVNSRMAQQKGSGVPYYIKNLYSALSKIQNNIVFFQTNGNTKLGFTEKFPCSANGFMGLLFDIILVLIFIYKYKPKLFHGPSFILPLIKPKYTKYVVTIHDLSIFTMPHIYSLKFRILYKWLIKKSINNADLIIAVSEHTKNDIIKYYKVNSNKITVIYPGLNEIFLNSKKSTPLLNEKYLLSITTHPKRKNILSVLESLAILKNKNIIITYVIVGIMSNNQKTMLYNKMKKLQIEDQVILRGYATEDELISLYQHAQLFIYPSFYEGFGFPIIEAMASKTLVITSNSSSMKELVTDNRFLVDPYDSKDIALKIESTLELSQSEKDKIIKKNYQFIKKFNRNKIALQYKYLFDIIINK